MFSKIKKDIVLKFAILLSLSSNLHAQHIYKIKTDSLLVTNDSCTAELNLENSTRNIKGFLYNKGNGRTEFRKGIINLPGDSLYIIGNDTLKISPAALNAWKLTGNASTNPASNFIGTTDNNYLVFRTNNIERMRLLANGNLLIGQTTDAGYKLDINGSIRSSANIHIPNTASGVGVMYMGNSQFLHNKGTRSIFLGEGAGNLNNTGSNNTGMGRAAFNGLTSGSSNSAYGSNALMSHSTGNQNTAIGMQALGYNSTGSNSTAVGVLALEQSTAGPNTAVGVWAGRNISTGTGNSFFGYYTGYSLQTGSNNSFFGHSIINSGIGNLTGNNNTAVGANIYNAGAGNYNTVVGANVSVPTVDNNIIIADGQGNQRIRIFNNGNTLVGHTTFTDAGYKLDVNGSTRINNNLYSYTITPSKQVFIGSPEGSYTGMWIAQTTPDYTNYAVLSMAGVVNFHSPGALVRLSAGTSGYALNVYDGTKMAIGAVTGYTTNYALDVVGFGGYGSILRVGNDNYAIPVAALTLEASTNSRTGADPGYGLSVLAKAENSSGSTVNVGQLNWIYSDVTAGTEDADFTIKNVEAGSLAEKFRITNNGKPVFTATNTASGTTGNQTIHKASGTVNMAASATAITVTNNLVSAASIVFAVIRSNDATATIKNVVPAAGSFTINLSASATAETSIGFWIIN